MSHPRPELLTPGEAARLLNLSAAGVKVHDAELKPLRTSSSGRRLYLREVVEAFAGRRAAFAASLAVARAPRQMGDA